MTLDVHDAGQLDYQAAHALQLELLQARIQEQVPDTLLLVEHPLIITMGRGSHLENIRRAEGIEVVECERGGDVTLHAPGQIVGYLIVDLRRWRRDLHAHLRRIEGLIIAALSDYRLLGERNLGRTGVWVGPRKIASIGVACRQWVSWHGFALNVSIDLSLFNAINPCGFPATTMTSMEDEVGTPIRRQEVVESLGRHARLLFGQAPPRVDEPPADP